MDKKKAIIITSSTIGVIVLGFVAYRIISRWNKTVVQDGNTTILISNDEPTNVEVVESSGEDTGEDKIITSVEEDLQQFEIESGMGDY